MRCTQRALAGCCGTMRSTFMDPQKKINKKIKIELSDCDLIKKQITTLSVHNHFMAFRQLFWLYSINDSTTINCELRQPWSDLVYHSTTHEEGLSNITEEMFVTLGHLQVGPCPKHKVVASRQNTTFHVEWNIDWSKTVQLILELMAVVFEKDETSCGAGLQPALH